MIWWFCHQFLNIFLGLVVSFPFFLLVQPKGYLLLSLKPHGGISNITKTNQLSRKIRALQLTAKSPRAWWTIQPAGRFPSLNIYDTCCSCITISLRSNWWMPEEYPVTMHWWLSENPIQSFAWGKCSRAAVTPSKPHLLTHSRTVLLHNQHGQQSPCVAEWWILMQLQPQRNLSFSWISGLIHLKKLVALYQHPRSPQTTSVLPNMLFYLPWLLYKHFVGLSSSSKSPTFVAEWWIYT